MNFENPIYYQQIVKNHYKKNISKHRQIISNILQGIDKRLLIIVGPCSIHNYEEAIEYSKKIQSLIQCYGDKIYFVMRCYCEKPRSTSHWKGFIYDPDLNNECNMDKGIIQLRKLYADISKLNIPIATEFICLLTSNYYKDFVSWSSIGARTCESQNHRVYISNLTMPIGIKNNRYGDIIPAIQGIVQSRKSHTMLNVNDNGQIALFKTNGNQNTHLVLRGGKATTNYDKESIQKSVSKLEQNQIQTGIIVDCSHGNSQCDIDSYHSYKNQIKVIENIIIQKQEGDSNIRGIMIESFLKEGKQAFSFTTQPKYGISITDSCISLEETEKIIQKLYNSL